MIWTSCQVKNNLNLGCFSSVGTFGREISKSVTSGSQPHEGESFTSSKQHFLQKTSAGLDFSIHEDAENVSELCFEILLNHILLSRLHRLSLVWLLSGLSEDGPGRAAELRAAPAALVLRQPPREEREQLQGAGAQQEDDEVPSQTPSSRGKVRCRTGDVALEITSKCVSSSPCLYS